ncbi:MAG TPA: glycosyltransferase family 2 protein [Puia sp.]
MLPLPEQPADRSVYLKPIEGFPVPASRRAAVKVSAVIITYNEAKNIRRTLSHLDWCDEIIIVDSYSTDETVAICREFNCTVYLKKFEGYGAQKQYAVSKASHDWILNIDADEVLSDSLFMEIASVMRKTPRHTGYYLAIGLVFFDKEFLYGKESWRYFLRLFNKNYGNFTDCPVHEKVRLKGPTHKFHHKMLHYSYSGIHQWEEKCSRYSTLAARNAVAKGRKMPVVLVILSLPFYFFKYYLLELNFLNGIEGFYWSVLSAYYHFIKYIKIRELYKAEKNKQIFNAQ